MTMLEGQLWTPRGWQAGRLHFGERIQENCALTRAPEHWIVPGFIDVHVHGGGGADVMDGESGIRELARFHARHGTTALLATTITNPWPHVLEALRNIRLVHATPGPGEASVLGAHLEGPFISPRNLGAQPAFTLSPDPTLIAEALELQIIRLVTLAPELQGAGKAAVQFVQSGVRVSLGHTVATADEADHVIRAVLEAGGEIGGTHLFNAMTGLKGREPGVVGALLARPEAYAEVILDGHHVHPTSFRSVLQAKPERTLLITDAMRAAGMPDGDYDLGVEMTTVRDGQARRPNGGLAGSLLTMDEALRQAVDAGLPLHLAVATTVHPARYLGLPERGFIEVGRWADVVVLGSDLRVEQVYMRGHLVHQITYDQNCG